jgi:hydroxypyruvate reductase
MTFGLGVPSGDDILGAVPPSLERLRHDAIAIYDAALQGVEPRRALTRALAVTPPPERVRLLAFGKAAYPMTAAAVQHLDRLEVPIAGGLLVTPDEGAPPDPRIRRLTGDHPLPEARSGIAAEAIAEAIRPVDPREEVWVLLSGGATSLIGAPVEGLSPLEYRNVIRALGRLGLPIAELNRVRKRFSRWGGGRLAAAIRAVRTRVFAMSDVPGDSTADIGSGPCDPDPATAADIRELLGRLATRTEIPEVAFRWLDRVERGEVPETPKPGDPAFHNVTTRVIASNAVAREQAAIRAVALGYHPVVQPELVVGEAARAGIDAARRIRRLADSPRAVAWIGGGETTVSLAADHGVGGRCQEFALAAARELAFRSDRPHAVVLAAGTDGRDGPTDAAGAVVDPGTWARIEAAAIDPQRALDRHDAYAALSAAGDLLRPGLTGTNVMDILVALIGGPSD